MKQSETSFKSIVQARIPAGGTVKFENIGSDMKMLELSHIYADNPSQGWGTMAMEIIVEEADRLGVSLSVLPVFGPENDRLIRFYKRYGFVDYSGEKMMYHRYIRLVTRNNC